VGGGGGAVPGGPTIGRGVYKSKSGRARARRRGGGWVWLLVWGGRLGGEEIPAPQARPRAREAMEAGGGGRGGRGGG
ncbi:hypothetical protein, partial [Salmonella enterica]|uniref:hypothetical protein n=1 Tax=Salmonella enterica TaxID=28901 RepID=UPI002892AD50